MKLKRVVPKVLIPVILSNVILTPTFAQTTGVAGSFGTNTTQSVPLKIATAEYKLISIYESVLSASPNIWRPFDLSQVLLGTGIYAGMTIGELLFGWPNIPANIFEKGKAWLESKEIVNKLEDLFRPFSYKGVEPPIKKLVDKLNKKWYGQALLRTVKSSVVGFSLTYLIRYGKDVIFGNAAHYIPPSVLNKALRSIRETIYDVHSYLSTLQLPPEIKKILNEKYTAVEQSCKQIPPQSVYAKEALVFATLGIGDIAMSVMHMTAWDDFERCYKAAEEYLKTVKEVIPPEILYNIDNPEKIALYQRPSAIEEYEKQLMIAGQGNLATVIDKIPQNILKELLKNPVVQEKVLKNIDVLPPELQKKVYKALEELGTQLKIPLDDVQKIKEAEEYLNILLSYVPPTGRNQLEMEVQQFLKECKLNGFDEEKYRTLLSAILVSIVGKYQTYLVTLDEIAPDASKKLKDIVLELANTDPTDQNKVLSLIREAEGIIKVIDQVLAKDAKEIDKDITSLGKKIEKLLEVYGDETIRTEYEYLLTKYKNIQSKILANPSTLKEYLADLIEIKKGLLHIYNKLLDKVRKDPSKVVDVRYEKSIDNVVLIHGDAYATITYTVTDVKLKVPLSSDVEIPILIIPAKDGKVVKTVGVLRFYQEGDSIVIYASAGALANLTVRPSVVLQQKVGTYEVNYNIKSITSDYSIIGVHLIVRPTVTLGTVDVVYKLPFRVDSADSSAVKKLSDGRAVIVDKMYFEEGDKISKEYLVRTPDLKARIIEYQPLGEKEGYKVYSVTIEIINNAQEDFKDVTVTVPISVEESDTLSRVVILTPEGTRQFINDPLALLYGVPIKVTLLPAGTTLKYTILYYTQPWIDAANELIDSAQNKYNSLVEQVQSLKELGYIVPRELDKMLQELSSKIETLKYAAKSKDKQLFEKTLREFNELYEETLKKYKEVEYKMLSDRDYATRVLDRAEKILEEISKYIDSEKLKEYAPDKYQKFQREYMNAVHLRDEVLSALENKEYRKAKELARMLDSKVTSLKTEVLSTVDSILTMKQAEVQAKILELLSTLDKFINTEVGQQLTSIYAEIKVLAQTFLAELNSKETIDEKLSYIESIESRLNNIEFAIKTQIASILPQYIENVEEIYEKKESFLENFKKVLDKVKQLPDVTAEQIDKALSLYKTYMDLLDKAKDLIDKAKTLREKDPITAYRYLMSAKDYLEDIDEENPVYQDLHMQLYDTRKIAMQLYKSIEDSISQLRYRYEQYYNKLPENERVLIEQQLKSVEEKLEYAKKLLQGGDYAKALSILQDIRDTELATLSNVLLSNIQNIEEGKNKAIYSLLIALTIIGIAGYGAYKNRKKILDLISKLKGTSENKEIVLVEDLEALDIQSRRQQILIEAFKQLTQWNPDQVIRKVLEYLRQHVHELDLPFSKREAEIQKVLRELYYNPEITVMEKLLDLLEIKDPLLRRNTIDELKKIISNLKGSGTKPPVRR